MRVIEKRETKPWAVQVQCTGHGNSPTGKNLPCGSLLEVEMNDLRYFDGSGGYFERDNAVVLRCPICECLTDLQEDKWPHNPTTNLKPFSTKWKETGVDKPFNKPHHTDNPYNT